MTTPKPVSPVEAWGIVTPERGLRLYSLRDTEMEAIRDFSLDDDWEELKAHGYRAVKLRVEVVE